MNKRQRLINKLKGKKISIENWELCSKISTYKFIDLLRDMIGLYSADLDKGTLGAIIDYLDSSCQIEIEFTTRSWVEFKVIDDYYRLIFDITDGNIYAQYLDILDSGKKEIICNSLSYDSIPMKELKKYVAYAKRSHNDEKILL